MNKNDLKKLIGECIKEMSNDGDEFKVFDTDVDRSMARQKDLAFGTGEIKFKSNTGTERLFSTVFLLTAFFTVFIFFSLNHHLLNSIATKWL